MTGDEASARIRTWFDAALAAVDPERAVVKHLAISDGEILISGQPFRALGRIMVIAVGKAAVPMARAAEFVLGDRISGGIALTKDGHAGGPPLRWIQTRVASHPIPDARGVAATTDILELLAALTAADLVIALISGGGSALLEAPVEGVSLDDIAAITSLLLKAGAPIDHLNAVRIPLSRVKGGALRRAAANTPFATLILSDVLGNDPSVIASGPTVPGSATGARALELLNRYGLSEHIPGAAVPALEHYDLVPVDISNDALEIIADNRTAVDAFAKSARADGERVSIVWSDSQGEARILAREWIARVSQETEASLLLGGGEATVTVQGNGEGGRNTEFALAAALELEALGRTDWVVASLATDGQDAVTGFAGAIASSTTLERSRAFGVNPEAALVDNDSVAVFRAAGGLVETGPTGTNVNDIYVALRLT